MQGEKIADPQAAAEKVPQNGVDEDSPAKIAGRFASKGVGCYNLYGLAFLALQTNPVPKGVGNIAWRVLWDYVAYPIGIAADMRH